MILNRCFVISDEYWIEYKQVLHLVPALQDQSDSRHVTRLLRMNKILELSTVLVLRSKSYVDLSCTLLRFPEKKRVSRV